jgi:hypothetical protein
MSVNNGFMFHKRHEQRGRTCWNCAHEEERRVTGATRHPLGVMSAEARGHAPNLGGATGTADSVGSNSCVAYALLL